jgi:flagellar biosynthetic protein FliR
MPVWLAHTQQQFLGFLMVFCRVASMLLTAPVFGGSQVPGQLKAAFSLVLSAVVFSGLGFPALAPAPGTWVLGIAGELAMGLGIGLLGTLAVAAVQMGGEVIGIQMGFGIVNIMDPTSNLQTSLIGQFKFFVATLVLLAINGHHDILRAIHRSFAFVPPGQIVLRAAMGGFLVDAGTIVFEVAVRVAAPIIVSILVVNFAFGIISRTIPQINFLIDGFAFKIFVGLFILWLGITAYVGVMQSLFEALPRQYMGFIRLFAP